MQEHITRLRAYEVAFKELSNEAALLDSEIEQKTAERARLGQVLEGLADRIAKLGGEQQPSLGPTVIGPAVFTARWCARQRNYC